MDAYQMATDRICEILEQGIKPWAKPWSFTGYAWSGVDGHRYSFLNTLLLSTPGKKYNTMEEILEDVRGEWLTYNQAKARGGNVRKGEHGRKVIYFTMLTEKDENGNEVEGGKRIPCMKVYTVFHVRQCEGIEQKYHVDEKDSFDFESDGAADRIASAYLEREGITYKQVRGDRAYYSPATDTVVTPLPEQFKDSAEFYTTLFHELTHSTGHEKRLNRISTTAAANREDYSLEELVAEIGSASICATLGMESMENSAAYIAGWLKALRNDKTMIVKASARAEKAVKMILGD